MLRQYKTKFKVKTKVVIFRENENGSFSELTAKSGFNCTVITEGIYSLTQDSNCDSVVNLLSQIYT